MLNFLYRAAKSLIDFIIGTLARYLPPLRAKRLLRSFEAHPPYQPTLPVNLADVVGPLAASFHQVVTFKPHHVYELEDVRISWDGAVFRNLRVFPASIVHARFIRRFQDTFLLRQWLGPQIRLPVDTLGVIVTHDQWSAGNYYHWLVDTLPRLLVIQNAYPQHRLLLPQPLPPQQVADYVTKSAEALGFHRFFPLNTRQILRAPQVIVPELTAESLHQNPVLMQQVRDILRAKLSPISSNRQRRIYASRSTQSIRKLTNELAILPMLAAHGFEVVHFEKLSFLEQVGLMSETSIFAGVHGANMTNLMFLPSEAVVVEFLNADHGDLCYFRLASCIGLPYYCVPCASTHPDLHNQSDLTVDTGFVARTLAHLTESVAH